MSYRFHFMPEPLNSFNEFGDETQEDFFETFDAEVADAEEYESELGRRPRHKIQTRSKGFRSQSVSSKIPRRFQKSLTRLGTRRFPPRPIPPRRPRFPRRFPFPFPFPVRPLLEPVEPGSGSGSSGPNSSDVNDGSISTVTDNGEYTRWVQTSLNKALDLNLTVDGAMNVETRSAIRSFQKQKNLPVDGVVGPPTENALIEAVGNQPPKEEGGEEPPENESFGFFDAQEFETEVNRKSKEYIKWIQKALSKLAAKSLPQSGLIDAQTREAIKAFQGQMHIKADGIVGKVTEQKLIRASGSTPPGTTALTQRFDYPEVSATLPRSGPGFYSYKRFAASQFGLPETIKALQSIAAEWHRRHPSGPRIGIGDLSLRGGGDIPGHASHEQGVDIDILPMRNDGQDKRITIHESQYSRQLTQELVTLIHKNGILRVGCIYFNDASVKGVKKWPNHDNHLHIRFCAPSVTKCNCSKQPKKARSEFEFDEYETESFNYEDEVKSKTKVKCKKDWCDSGYVRWVQRSLNQILGLQLKEDGDLEKRTRSAIRSFQQKNGLRVDSSLGPATEKALIAAGASRPPEIKQMPCGTTDGKDLIKLLNKYRGDIPLHFLLGWIEVESGRRNDSLTNLCERGYFQVHPEEAKDFGIKNHQDISYNKDHSVQAGVEVVKRCAMKAKVLAQKYGLSNQGDLFLGLVKLHHWIPSGPAKILSDMKAHGIKPVSWNEFKQYVASDENRKRLIKTLKGFDPVKGADNADKTLIQASKWLGKIQTEGLNRELEFDESEMSVASPVPQSVLSLFRMGLESAGIKLAIAFGYKNETQLTDLIFNSRHPERFGRGISKSEPNYKELVNEWINIRNSTVRPALSGSTAAPATGTPGPVIQPTTQTNGLDIVSVRGIKVARQIAQKIEALLAAAEADGIKLSGGGYRSYEKQVELRKSHCGTSHYDIYEKPSKECSPPTATPGRSQHEKGLAIDFTYNGSTIKSRSSPAFQWLAQNASRFGLYNLPSEPWHWSVNGK